jgi:hypothetical protein
MELDAGVALHVIVGVADILILHGVAGTFTWSKPAMSRLEDAKAVPSKRTLWGSWQITGSEWRKPMSGLALILVKRLAAAVAMDRDR